MASDRGGNARYSSLAEPVARYDVAAPPVIPTRVPRPSSAVESSRGRPPSSTSGHLHPPPAASHFYSSPGAPMRPLSARARPPGPPPAPAVVPPRPVGIAGALSGGYGPWDPTSAVDVPLPPPLADELTARMVAASTAPGAPPSGDTGDEPLLPPPPGLEGTASERWMEILVQLAGGSPVDALASFVVYCARTRRYAVGDLWQRTLEALAMQALLLPGAGRGGGQDAGVNDWGAPPPPSVVASGGDGGYTHPPMVTQRPKRGAGGRAAGAARESAAASAASAGVRLGGGTRGGSGSGSGAIDEGYGIDGSGDDGEGGGDAENDGLGNHGRGYGLTGAAAASLARDIAAVTRPPRRSRPVSAPVRRGWGVGGGAPRPNAETAIPDIDGELSAIRPPRPRSRRHARPASAAAAASPSPRPLSPSAQDRLRGSAAPRGGGFDVIKAYAASLGRDPDLAVGPSPEIRSWKTDPTVQQFIGYDRSRKHAERAYTRSLLDREKAFLSKIEVRQKARLKKEADFQAHLQRLAEEEEQRQKEQLISQWWEQHEDKKQRRTAEHAAVKQQLIDLGEWPPPPPKKATVAAIVHRPVSVSLIQMAVQGGMAVSRGALPQKAGLVTLLDFQLGARPAVVPGSDEAEAQADAVRHKVMQAAVDWRAAAIAGRGPAGGTAMPDPYAQGSSSPPLSSPPDAGASSEPGTSLLGAWAGARATEDPSFHAVKSGQRATDANAFFDPRFASPDALQSRDPGDGWGGMGGGGGQAWVTGAAAPIIPESDAEGRTSGDGTSRELSPSAILGGGLGLRALTGEIGTDSGIDGIDSGGHGRDGPPRALGTRGVRSQASLFLGGREVVGGGATRALSGGAQTPPTSAPAVGGPTAALARSISLQPRPLSAGGAAAGWLEATPTVPPLALPVRPSSAHPAPVVALDSPGSYRPIWGGSRSSAGAAGVTATMAPPRGGMLRGSTSFALANPSAAILTPRGVGLSRQASRVGSVIIGPQGEVGTPAEARQAWFDQMASEQRAKMTALHNAPLAVVAAAQLDAAAQEREVLAAAVARAQTSAALANLKDAVAAGAGVVASPRAAVM